MAGLQGGAAVVAGVHPSPHRHTFGMETLCAESCSILHEAVCGADTERSVVVFGILCETDHHVFVQMSLAS